MTRPATISVNTKVCAGCGVALPVTEFGRKPRGSVRMLLPECRQCQGPRVRQCACGAEVATRVGKPVCPACQKDPRANGRRRDRQRTLRQYGLTEADWAALLDSQGGRCAICRTETPGGRDERWHIDHDHVTGQVRGLLCGRCNPGIGFFRDDPDLILAAAQYIFRHREPTEETP